jgi:predicted transcriptional regulator
MTAKTITAKAEVMDIVQKMPDEATLEEIVEQLNVRFQIEDGLRELDAGQGIPHDEAMRRLSKWLS